MSSTRARRRTAKGQAVPERPGSRVWRRSILAGSRLTISLHICGVEAGGMEDGERRGKPGEPQAWRWTVIEKSAADVEMRIKGADKGWADMGKLSLLDPIYIAEIAIRFFWIRGQHGITAIHLKFLIEVDAVCGLEWHLLSEFHESTVLLQSSRKVFSSVIDVVARPLRQNSASIQLFLITLSQHRAPMQRARPTYPCPAVQRDGARRSSAASLPRDSMAESFAAITVADLPTESGGQRA